MMTSHSCFHAVHRLKLFITLCSKINVITLNKKDDARTKVGTDVRAQELGISGVNFCPGIRFCKVNFARALGFW